MTTEQKTMELMQTLEVDALPIGNVPEAVDILHILYPYWFSYFVQFRRLPV